MINGKEQSEFEISKIDSKNIEKMEAYKGEKATMRYGERAKNGAIVITLKKK